MEGNLTQLEVELEKVLSQLHPSIVEQLEGELWALVLHTPLVDKAIWLQGRIEDKKRFSI